MQQWRKSIKVILSIFVSDPDTRFAAWGSAMKIIAKTCWTSSKPWLSLRLIFFQKIHLNYTVKIYSSDFVILGKTLALLNINKKSWTMILFSVVNCLPLVQTKRWDIHSFSKSFLTPQGRQLTEMQWCANLQCPQNHNLHIKKATPSSRSICIYYHKGASMSNRSLHWNAASTDSFSAGMRR